jgi:hypothetical protein
MILTINALSTLPELSQSNCGTLKGNLYQSPQSIGDCTKDTSKADFSCCSLTYKDKVSAIVTRCYLQQTKLSAEEKKTQTRNEIENLYNVTLVDLQCDSSYLMSSFLVFLAVALLF